MSDIKLLKNATLSDISLKTVGIDIPASGQYEIEVSEYLRFSTTDFIAEVTPHINAGDILVNDGISDLTAAEGIRLLEHSFRLYTGLNGTDVTKVVRRLNFQGDVSALDNGDGKVTITVGETGQSTGKIVDFIFTTSGNTSDKWLEVSGGSAPSNTLPLIMPQDGIIDALTFSNEDDNVDVDLEVFKNGTTPSHLIYCWEIRNKRNAFLTDINGIGTLSQGDRISLFLKKNISGTGDTTAQDPFVEVFIKLTSDYKNEGGQQLGD